MENLDARAIGATDDIGIPTTPRERIIVALFCLFLETCNTLAAADAQGEPTTADELDRLELALYAALGIRTSLAEARAFLEADAGHCEGTRIDRSALRCAYRDAEALRALVARANARHGRRRRVV
ncbi:MAG: hypothetical protein ACK5ZR_00440 [Gemmatimonadaceae bacterium]